MACACFPQVHLLKLCDQHLVAKAHILPRGREKDWADVKATVRQYLLAKELTSRFVKRVKETQRESALKMKFVTTDVLALPSGE